MDFATFIDACKMGNVPRIKEGLTYENQHQVCENGYTALSHASSKGHLDAVALLLPGSDAKHVNGDGDTPFVLAIRSKHWAIVDLLLPLSDVRHVNPKSGLSALNSAIGMDLHPFVERLLPLCDLNHQDMNGSTYLMEAARVDANMVAFFLPTGDVNHMNKAGYTALMWAVIQRRIDVVRFLLPLCDANIANEDGNTALMLFLREGRYGRNHLPMVKALLQKSRWDLVNHRGENALAIARNNDKTNVDVLNLLVEHERAMLMSAAPVDTVIKSIRLRTRL